MFEICGYVGMVLILLAYFLVSRGAVGNKSIKYHSMNILGAVLLGINAWHHNSIPIVLLEIAWASIGIYTLLKKD